MLKIPNPPRRKTSIQSQLRSVIGLLLVLGTLIALIGYLSLRNYQAGVETTLTEANTLRELSLKIQNEFLLARQAEIDLSTGPRTLGFATLTAATTASRRHMENATLALEQMDRHARAAHDPQLRTLTEDIEKLGPQLRTYQQAFLAMVNAMQKRSSAGGLVEEMNHELTQLENALAALPEAEWRLLILRIRTNEQAYFNTDQQEYMDNARLLTNQLITRLTESTAADLTTLDGRRLDQAELIQRAETAIQIFDQLVKLEQDIMINRTLFEGITLRVNQVIGDIGDKSDAGLARARAQLAAVSLSSTLALGFTAALAIGLGSLAATVLSRRITQPLNQLTQAAQRMGQGDLTQQVSIRGGQELETLADTFNVMAEQLRQTLGGLEQQVAARTRDLERRATQIATGAEIARVASTLLDPDRLLPQVVNLIQERFGFYYAGLFLVDAENRYAVLQQGTGEAGRIMKERGHRLEVGGQSMVGWVCAHKRARIALDVGKDAVRFANPFLPETRSEMALPLRVGDRVIGVLDVQSTQMAAFDEGDITALQGMADQIAVALENARLFQQTQRALKELDEANRLLARQGWEAYLTMTPVHSAEFRSPGAPSTTGALPATLRLPLEWRGQPIGTLVMERAESHRPWTEAEIEAIRAIVQQATLALESARLFEDAQHRAARERLLGEITTRIRSSTTLETVLNTALREIHQVTGADYAVIELEPAPEE